MSKASVKAWFDRHKQINTWLTLVEFSAVQRLAEAQGITLSAFAREAILSYEKTLRSAK